MAFFLNFKRSALELKSLRCQTTTAVLIALDLALKMATTIKITETIKITFAFLALATIGMLFGPVVAGLAGIITDVAGYFIKPDGAFNPLFTIVEMVGAIIYGIFLYNLNPLKFNGGDFTKQNVFQVLRIIFAKLTVIIVCNLIMTPAAMIISGYTTLTAVTVGYPIRVAKSLAMLPIEVIMLLVILPGVMLAYKQATKNLPQRAAKTH